MARPASRKKPTGKSVPRKTAKAAHPLKKALKAATPQSAPTEPTTPDQQPNLTPGADLREYQDWHEYERLLDRPVMMKLPELERDARLRHIIFSQQFNRSTLDRLCQVTTKLREIGDTRDGSDFLATLLRHKGAMLYFTQASTRTFLSFKRACEKLGMVCTDIRDASVSSEAKGESPLDSIRMFSSYFDVIVMRARYPRFAEACAYVINDMERTSDVDRVSQRGVPIINAGSGADEHPTQALLDIYTMQRVFSFESRKDSARRNRFDELRKTYKDLTRGIDGKTVCFCGDIGRGRTVRSLAQLLTLYKNITLHFVYPPHPKLQLSADFRELLLEEARKRGNGMKIYESHRLEDVIDQIDVLYMTRIQREHDSGDKYRQKDMEACQLTSELRDRMRQYAAIMHPFPRDGRDPEIPFEIDQDPRAMYFEQSHNGMWARAALLSYLFNVDGEVYSEHERRFARRHDYNEAVIG
jgi:aspartate carbamoyltransferase catalytic subunit